nr:unnamed protein product [Callosobruchus chinensis]
MGLCVGENCCVGETETADTLPKLQQLDREASLLFLLRLGVNARWRCCSGLCVGELNTLYAEWTAESGLGVM